MNRDTHREYTKWLKIDTNIKVVILLGHYSKVQLLIHGAHKEFKPAVIVLVCFTASSRQMSPV